MSFKNGDSCFDSRLKMPNTKYSTIITFICDITENEVQKTNSLYLTH